MKKYLGLFLTIVIFLFCAESPGSPVLKSWKINSSNPLKVKEFNRLFADYGYTVSMTKINLKEINADPIKVAVHKATQVAENILIDDTSLDVEGANIGVNLKSMINRLTDYVGRQATWRVTLAYRIADIVVLYQGVVKGKLVAPQGGEGFEAVFLPDGATETLAQNKPDEFNARALAVKSLLSEEPLLIESAITEWDGPWQQNL